MADLLCSFCTARIGLPLAKDQPPLAVAGPKAFICRDCIELCVRVMSADPEWRDQQIEFLRNLQP